MQSYQRRKRLKQPSEWILPHLGAATVRPVCIALEATLSVSSSLLGPSKFAYHFMETSPTFRVIPLADTRTAACS